jgi:hypothetical protein
MANLAKRTKRPTDATNIKSWNVHLVHFLPIVSFYKYVDRGELNERCMSFLPRQVQCQKKCRKMNKAA